MKVFILLPAYNEEEGLEKILARIKRVLRYLDLNSEIIIINDGSKDRTKLIAKIFEKLEPNITSFSFESNKGITEVFREGFKYVYKKLDPDDIVISLDSDNTQSPYAIIDMVKQIKQGNDLVIASRFVMNAKVEGVPKYRLLLSNGVAFIMQSLFPYPGVKDYSTFYRAYKGSLILNAVENENGFDEIIEGHGFSSMAGFLMNLIYRCNPNVTEVPINLRYDLKEGGSGLKIFKTIKGYLLLFRKLNIIKNGSKS